MYKDEVLVEKPQRRDCIRFTPTDTQLINENDF